MADLRRLDKDQGLNPSSPYVDVDLFASDAALQAAVAAGGSREDGTALSSFGRRWGSAEMLELGRLANEYAPRLQIFDARGFRRDLVEFHPAYHRLMTESIEAGLHASTWSDDATPRPASMLSVMSR